MEHEKRWPKHHMVTDESQKESVNFFQRQTFPRPFEKNSINIIITSPGEPLAAHKRSYDASENNNLTLKALFFCLQTHLEEKILR